MQKQSRPAIHAHLSFDGCGINGRDEYRTRIATFAKVRSPEAYKYGPLFEAAPDMLTALEDAEFLMRQAAKYPGPMQDSFKRSAKDARDAIARAKGQE